MVTAQRIAAFWGDNMMKQYAVDNLREVLILALWRYRAGDCPKGPAAQMENWKRRAIDTYKRDAMFKHEVDYLAYACLMFAADIHDAGGSTAINLLSALQEIATICDGGVLERRETGKPNWIALESVSKIARAAIAKATGGAK